MTVNVTIEVGTHSTLSQLVEAHDLLRSMLTMRGAKLPAEPTGFETKVEEDSNKQTETAPNPSGTLTTPTAEPALTEVSAPPAAPAKPRGRPSKPPVAKTYTIDEVRAVLVEKSKAGVEAVEKQRSMLHSMGYEKLSEVPIERYTELMEKAQAL